MGNSKVGFVSYIGGGAVPVDVTETLEKSELGILLLDDNRRVVWANRAFESFFTVVRERLTGADAVQLIRSGELPLDRPEEMIRRLETPCFPNPGAAPLEIHVPASDGRPLRWLENWCQPVPSGPYAGGRVELFRDISARKQVGYDLDELRMILQTIGALIVLADSEGNITHVSRSAKTLLGHECEDLLGDGWWRSVQPDERLRARQKATVARLARGELAIPAAPLERILSCKDGTEKCFHWHFARTARGGLIGIAYDVTDLKSMEKRLSKLSLAVEQSPASIVITDAQGDIEYVNPAFTALTGYSREEVLGKNPRILKSGRTPPEEYKRLWETITAGKQWSGEFHNRKKNGELYIESALISPMLAPDGTITNFVAVKIDITARKKAEQELRDVREHLETLVDAAPVGIVTLDLDGRVKTWNAAAAKIFGWEAQQVIGQPLPPVPEEKSAEYRRIREQTIAGNGVRQLETQRVRRDGRIIEISLSTALVRDVSGNPAGTIAVIEDITERKRMQEQLLQSQRLEAVGRLAGGVAHDFNNLLTTIIGYTDLLSRQGASPDDASEGLAAIAHAGEKAVSLVRQLLAFGRRQTLNPRNLNLNHVVANARKLLQRLVGEDIELTVSFAPDLGIVRADETQIEQVLINLVANSRDATPSGGRITIEAQNVELDEAYCAKHAVVEPGAYVLLSVADSGCGMDAETQEHIFEPFFTTKAGGKGTGLGLATVYGIVKQSGGYIWVYSEPGRGTTFKVYLPRVASPADEPESRPGQRDKIVGGTETILLVEDEPQLRGYLRSVLNRLGYTVLVATDGAEALRTARAYPDPIHLVLTDVVMPNLGGTDLAAAIARTRHKPRIVYMSGYSDEMVSSRGLAVRPLHFLEKPFDAQRLAREIRRALDAPCSPDDVA